MRPSETHIWYRIGTMQIILFFLLLFWLPELFCRSQCSFSFWIHALSISAVSSAGTSSSWVNTSFFVSNLLYYISLPARSQVKDLSFFPWKTGFFRDFSTKISRNICSVDCSFFLFTYLSTVFIECNHMPLIYPLFVDKLWKSRLYFPMIPGFSWEYRLFSGG